MNLKIFIFSIFSLSLFTQNTWATSCASSLDQLEQNIHLSDFKKEFPQRLDDRLLGRFKSSKGFYVFESKNQLFLGIDGGFLLGKMTYPLKACPKNDGSLLVTAKYNGKNQNVVVTLEMKGQTPSITLSQGTGPLARFNGTYLRQNVSLQDIEQMFMP